MTRDDTLAGVQSRTIETDRLETHLLESADPDADGDPVVFLHGNVSSSRFFEDRLTDLPESHYAIAPDLRGYGDSETKPVDATNGLGDFAGDLEALFDELGLETPVTLVGWSNGGGAAMRYALENPERVSTLVLVNPLSPYGFGGTKDLEGTPCFDDYAGSGGGTGNDEFVAGLTNRDRGEEGEASPRKILRTYYVDPTHEFDEEREESYLTGMLDTATGDENYPGSAAESENWPGVAPGETGVNNAIAPKYCDLSGITDIDPDEKPPVLWIRGDSDQIVSNESLFDLGTLGRMGQLPDWPGEDVFPPQPMVDQTRAVLEEYADAGGEFEEVVFSNVGHTPHLEVPSEFMGELEGVLE
ncbi:alpha/beta hydrolase [Natronobacterium texcoconense]|uniref:Pimeloyl-ACP methyl ester carboxylesterase n=1 Tax=Natronobacterium texcoconense TaxID=1095778 RepID=A0A1H1IFG3_NATTX|nr:alpha/beta hydrolase [Natronobacterium texcoconense]SDR36421.1 Pimeloyl-ACP methyl ester carboxylesterase [Natronobacterium texcoconense]